MRWLILIAALGGAGLSILFPQTSGASHVGYQVWITPPGGEDNTHIQLNCGWHTGCGAGIGGALDWYNYAVNVVYFRGGFYREGTPLSIGYMHMRRFGWFINDADYCDTTVAELWDTQANKIRFVTCSPKTEPL